MVVVIGIDPDSKCVGLGLVQVQKGSSPKLIAVCKSPPDPIVLFEAIDFLVGGLRVDLVAVEGQVIYEGQQARGKARPKDIVTLAQIAGMNAATARLATKAPAVFYDPYEWKGQVPKDIQQARTFTKFGILYERAAASSPYCYPSGCSVASSVRGALRLNKGDWKHVADGVGIALFAAERLSLLG